MELQVKILTPLWTGGAETGKVDRIHETGILGSLRWWYEVLSRGLGGKVCVPNRKGCQLNIEKYEKNHSLSRAGLCDVCQVFGATGWRRRVQLIITDQTYPDTLRVGNRDMSEEKESPRMGTLSIRIQSYDTQFPSAVIGGLIQFIADWAAIGGRTTRGYGVIKLESGRCETKQLYNWLENVTPGCERYSGFPSLQNLFFARVQLKDSKNENTFSNIKRGLNQLFAEDKNLQSFLMGVVNKQRIASKIKVSLPYDNGIMRVWGWVPEKAEEYRNGWTREKIVHKIYKDLQEKYNLSVWRELNSPRDTVNPGNGDVKKFLRSLLEL